MSRPKARYWAFLVAASALCSCSLVSLESLAISTEPAADGETVPPEGPIKVSFSIEPKHDSAESAFKLNSAAGASSGDFRWSGRELSYYPVPPLKKGCRWTLSLAGKVKALDGRSFDVDEAVSFFAGSSSSLLTIDSFKPALGATVSTNASIILGFSRKIDQTIFARNFSLSPSTGYDASWSADGKTVTLAPKTRWTSLSTYSWQVKAELADADGVGMARAYEGAFIVQEDGAAPSIVSARPALFADGELSPLAAGLGELGYRDAIYLSFSEEVTLESVSGAVKISPTLRGRILQDGPAGFAFVPEEGFAARTRYKLTVLASVADLAGNEMSEDYVAWFEPRVADLKILRAFINGGSAVSGFGDAYCYGLAPSISDGSGTIALEFNVSITDPAERDRIVSLISCSSLFPSSLSPALKSVQWASLSRLELTYAGFSASTASRTYYYKLLIPGGESGISDGSGGTMEKDLWLVIFTD
jgi:hypothetical protein